jgi:uncharacterized protein YkwD
MSGCATDDGFGQAGVNSGANLGIGVDGYKASTAELAVHDQVNDYRVEWDLEGLDFADTVGSIARAHSLDMAEGTAALGHSGFEDRADDVIEVVSGTSSVGENVGRVDGAETQEEAAEAMMTFWRESSDHDENLLHDGWDLAGVGAAQADDGSWYFTQVYVGVGQ